MDESSYMFQDIKQPKHMEEITSDSNACTRPVLERKARPQEQLNCPRCNSTNTKFCYYNNYSLTQPRYFCKTCRRYWTEGGSLRNVPVGGGSRKNKRSSSSAAAAAASASSNKLPDLNPPSLSQFSSQNPKNQAGQGLNLAFPSLGDSQGISHYVEVPGSGNTNQHSNSPSSSSYNNTSHLSALELLRTGITSRGLNSYIPTPMPDTNTLYSSGFPLPEFKPTLSFSVDGLGNRYGGQEIGTGAGRFLFPFGEMKQLPNTNEVDQNKGEETPSGYWTAKFGNGGGSW